MRQTGELWWCPGADDLVTTKDRSAKKVTEKSMTQAKPVKDADANLMTWVHSAKNQVAKLNDLGAPGMALSKV